MLQKFNDSVHEKHFISMPISISQENP